MKIERYISVLVVLVAVLFLVNTAATFAEVQASAVSNPVQCTAPVNTWCVPATAGAGISGTFCTTNVPAPVRSASPVVTSAETLGNVIGSILAAPFVMAQCILGECP